MYKQCSAVVMCFADFTSRCFRRLATSEVLSARILVVVCVIVRTAILDTSKHQLCQTLRLGLPVGVVPVTLLFCFLACILRIVFRLSG